MKIFRFRFIFIMQLLITSVVFSQTATIDIPITMTDNADGIQELRFGLAPTATDGIDTALGEDELPPFPPTGVFEARFVGDDISLPPLGQGSYRDYRTGDSNFNGTQTHELRYQVGAGNTITIGWNLPNGVTGLVQDFLGGVVVNEPMVGSGSYIVTNPGVINKLKMVITYGATSAKSITVLSPNGGENWEVNSVQNINWTSSNVENVKLEYTADNGVNWNTIIASTAATAVSYTWTVPNTPSAQSKVRISDASDATVYDESDALFTIAAASGNMVDIPITVTDNAGGMQELRFGLAPTATDGIDTALGEDELPPFPPTGVFEARFVGDDISLPPLGQGSYRDYRTGDSNFNGTQTHELRYQVGAGNTITIGWNLPNGVTGLVQDFLGGVVVNVAMQAQGSHTIDNPGVINKLKMAIIYQFTSSKVLQTPEIICPDEGALAQDSPTNFIWQDVEGAVSYHIQVSRLENFSDILFEDSALTSTNVIITTLEPSMSYFWRIRAKNSDGSSDWSNKTGFTTIPKTRKLYGDGAADVFGVSITAAGDVNGDGYPDFMIGAAQRNKGPEFTGEISLFFGDPGELPTNKVILLKKQLGDSLGSTSVAAVDLNGDGKTDIVKKAPLLPDEIIKIFIFYGGDDMERPPDLILSGESAEDYFGRSMTGVGDVNHDGFNDLLICAPYHWQGEEPGRAYLYFGGAEMDSIPDIVFTGQAAGDAFGTSCSGNGDLNGDGYTDIIIGSSAGDSGRVYVYFGSEEMDNIPDLILTGTQEYEMFGYSCSIIRDFNNDGYSDIVVGSPKYDEGSAICSGRAVIFLGGAQMKTKADLTLRNYRQEDRFGIAVADAGDINDDGSGDVIIGANHYYVEEGYPGKANIYFGGEDADAVVDISLVGEAPNERFGGAIANVGDYNQDGYDDLLIGANYCNTNGLKSGRVSIFNFARNTTAVSDDFTEDEAVPAEFSLLNNYPNPFNPATTIKFTLPKAARVTLKIYDLLGREIETLIHRELAAQIHQVEFKANNLPSGVYLFQLQVGSFRQTKKMMLIK